MKLKRKAIRVLRDELRPVFVTSINLCYEYVELQELTKLRYQGRFKHNCDIMSLPAEEANECS